MYKGVTDLKAQKKRERKTNTTLKMSLTTVLTLSHKKKEIILWFLLRFNTKSNIFIL